MRLWPLYILFFFQTTTQVIGQAKIDSLKLALEETPEDSLKIVILFNLRHVYQRVDLNIALDYALKAEKLAQEAGLEVSLAEAVLRTGTVLLNMSRFEEADAALAKAQTEFRRLGLGGREAIVIIEQARLAQQQSDIQKAFELYLKALPLVKSAQDLNAEARIYNYLGALYKIQKNIEKAIEQYTIALEIVRELNFKPGISACLSNLGTCNLELDQFDKALPYLKEALQLKNEIGDKLGASRAHISIGVVYNNTGKIEQATTHLQSALGLALEVDNPIEIASAKSGLAKNYLLRGNYNRAIEMATELLKTTEELKDIELMAKSFSLLAEAQSHVGMHEEAYKNSEAYIRLSDSIYNEKVLTVTGDLEAKYQNEQKVREIELQALQIEKAETERNFLIAIILVVLVLMVMVAILYRIKEKANEKLQELDQLKSDFFANISHEFRTPLSLIMAPLKDRMESDNVKEQEEAVMMYRNADRLLKLIDQILDLSKLESGKLGITKSFINVTSLFQVIAASFSSLAEHQRIHFTKDIAHMDDLVEVDEDILQKICYNLLSNAFKFTSAGGSVFFNVQLEDHVLSVVVHDSGPGLTKREKERVFDRFYQSADGAKTGTGIGLALTKELVELHGGKISVQSKSQAGSSFLVTIPVKTVQSSAQAEVTTHEIKKTTHSAEFSPEEIVKHGPAILIIEDNEDLRTYLAKTLQNDYTIYQSPNGEEGVNKAKEIIPDLIISDVMMPIKDGIEVCQDLKSETETNHIPIILLTARADQESKLSGLRHGADNYLLKPFDPNELRIRVVNLLEQRKVLKEKYGRLLMLKPHEIEITTSDESFLKQSLEVVNQHLDDPNFDIELFSKEVGLSRMQLHRKLTALSGLSATAFVRHQRLIRASKLLEGGESVSQVAYAVGFSSVSYFTKNFKKEFGVSPSEYAVKVD